MFNHSREKSAMKGLKQPAPTKACNRGGAATIRGFDPNPHEALPIMLSVCTTTPNPISQAHHLETRFRKGFRRSLGGLFGRDLGGGLVSGSFGTP